MTPPSTTPRTITPASTTFRFGLDKSSPYKKWWIFATFLTLSLKLKGGCGGRSRAGGGAG